MTMTAKHLKVSSKSDGADTSKVRPGDWNADHVIIGWRPNDLAAFTDVTGQALSSLIISDSKILATSDDSGAADDRVFGLCVRGDGNPQIELNGDGNWATGHLTRTGDAVKIRLTSSDSPLTARTAILYADGRSTTWSVTTDVAPSLPSGYTGWYRVGDVTYKDAGTTLCSNGDPIQQLNDLSGNSNHLFSTSTARPTYTASYLNGLPAAVFDGSNDKLQSASGMNANPCTLIIVGKFLSVSGFPRIAGFGQTRSIYDQGTTWGYYQDQTSGTLNMGGTASSFTTVVVRLETGVNHAPRLNGTNGSNLKANANASNPLILGDSGVGSEFGNVAIVEAVYYPSILSDSDCAIAEAYLRSRYGHY